MITNELALQLQTIEQDILDLKTAIPRVNNSTAGIYQDSNIQKGRYLVTYEASDSIIFSYFEAYGAEICPNTPVGNTQEFYINKKSSIRITSNRYIVSITPI